MRFTLRQLELFVAACEAGSLTAAAERQHIAQSAVSSAIQTLERALGVSLLLRHHAAGVSPTPEGVRFLERARELLGTAEELDRFSADLTTEVGGPLEVGCLVTVAPVVMPRLARSFLDRHPSVDLHLTEAGQDELLGKLRSGAISLALTYDLDVDPARFAHRSLLDLPPRAIVAADSPLAGRTYGVSLAELAEQPIVLLDLPLSGEYFLSLFRAQGIEPRVAHRSPHLEVVRSLVANGFGASLINIEPACLTSLDGGRLATLPLLGEHRPMRLGLASRLSRFESRTTAAFREHAVRELSRTVGESDSRRGQ
jgi:DNA-binding transcriptional LysR family regulator